MYQRPKPTLSVKEAAIALLSRRDHGEYELIQKLTQKGYEQEEAEQALSFCSECGYLDDLRFARSQVRQHVSKGHGERRIRQELNQKRVSDSDIQQALYEEEIDWFELARKVALKKFPDGRSSDHKVYAKQLRFLQYRGFDFEQIAYALARDEDL
ncbi:recombination regulator RecX [Vibrio sp. SCSIO 43136]|uniref:recombination regulator RecX n=1 Tax=Vibrio sp. SCSIO 43136 TaxID=2819101 RepID=UPI0020764DD3|nr:recombination regulator RecX [Vibrio sp. SCSIO 43136]USD65685.1 recombination regulator RecX [Vibrio sp. SCSIO 43136]